MIVSSAIVPLTSVTRAFVIQVIVPLAMVTLAIFATDGCDNDVCDTSECALTVVT